MNDQHNSKNKNIIRFVMILLILVLINITSSRLHKRFDLTAEHRFSLSQPTIKLLKSLDDVAVIEVYLKGKFPAGFQRLSEGTREVLQQFKEYGGNKIRFEFINPLEGKDDKEKKEIFEKLAQRGVNPVRLEVQQDAEDGYSEKIIFPAAEVSYNQHSEAVSLLESHSSMDPNDKLKYSETMLEYKLASAIKHLMNPNRKKIAYLVGNGEALGIETYDILTSLDKYYDVDTVDLNNAIDIDKSYAAAIVCKPSIAFNDKNKFKIDQYVMQGGRMLWSIDQLNFNMDSLRVADASMAIDYGLNLEDILFTYGVRINPDLVEDYQQCNPLPFVVGNVGNQPDIRLLPWTFFPFSIPTSKHPIVNNMDAVMFMFSSSIDTIANPEIKKTILLASSNRSRKVPSPVRVSLANLKFQPKAELYKEHDIPMAVLLEGKFHSIFSNRLDPNFIRVYEDSLHKKFSEVCNQDNSMVVISDGNMMLNDYSEKNGPMECGYYKFTKQNFANKTFILNCLEYLTDNYGLLEARNKDVKLRLLDMARIKKEKLQWQLINIAIPILVVLFFASAYFFFRKKKYEGKV